VTSDDLSPAALVALAIGIAVVGLLGATWVARRTAWVPAAGLALLVATPLVPNVPLVSGLSLDDILPLLGIAVLAVSVDLRRLAAVRPPLLLLAGLVLLIAAGTLSSVVNATGPAEAITMLFRGPGRVAYLAVIVTLVALTEPAERRARVVAVGMALVGTFEALFGLAAFFLPLGGVGLEPTRKFSVLYFEVPGRIAGTLGISPNFLGAIFILTMVLTTGLAITATTRRERLLLWAAILVQAFALTLTFTRASLGLAIVAVAVLLLVRGRIRYLVPVLVVVAVGFLSTPSVGDDTGNGATSGPGTPVAVERLTTDIPDRLALWYAATLMMVDHPVAGVGPGRMVAVEQTNPDRYMRTPVGYAQNNAHNTVLLAGAETGVVGAIGSLLVNLAIALAALRILLRGRRPDVAVIETAGSIAVLGYLAQGMVNNLFTVASAGVVFAVVAGAYVIRLETAPSARAATDGPAQRQRAPTGTPLEPTV
jgi:O-antigen ligase